MYNSIRNDIDYIRPEHCAGVLQSETVSRSYTTTFKNIDITRLLLVAAELRYRYY